MGLLPPNYRHLNRTVKYRSFYQPITDSLIAWPGGVREGRAAFATVSALPSQVFLIVKLFNGSEGSSLILQYIPLHPTDHASLLRLPTGIPGL